MNELIPDALEGERIDRVVAMVADGSRSRAATLVADGPVRVRRFPHDTLRNLEAQHPDLSHALLGGIAQGLAGKVRRDNG